MSCACSCTQYLAPSQLQSGGPITTTGQPIVRGTTGIRFRWESRMFPEKWNMKLRLVRRLTDSLFSYLFICISKELAYWRKRISGNPLQYSSLENSKDGRAWQATVHGLQRVRHDWAAEHEDLLLKLFIYLSSSSLHLFEIFTSCSSGFCLEMTGFI